MGTMHKHLNIFVRVHTNISRSCDRMKGKSNGHQTHQIEIRNDEMNENKLLPKQEGLM